MIEIGVYSELEIIEELATTFTIGESDGEKLALAKENCPGQKKVGDKVRVYVYRDHNRKKIASCRKPFIERDQFAYLKVVQKSEEGALVDWGMESLLFIPYDEQKQPMEVGEYHFVYLDIEEEGSTFYGSTFIDEWLQNEEINVKEGDKVKIMIWRKTNLGYAVIVNDEHEGLVYENEVFTKVEIGQIMDGYIKKIREENKLDISLQPLGYRHGIDTFTDIILAKLEAKNGFLPFNDKSSPADIYAVFGMSKKAFKRAIGGLYKRRIISITSKGIKLMSK